VQRDEDALLTVMKAATIPQAPVLGVTTGSITSRRFSVGALTVTGAEYPAFASGLHAHARWMCTVTVAGRWSEHRGGRTSECTRGVLLFKPPAETHWDRFEGRGAEVVMLELEPASIPEYLLACTTRLERAGQLTDSVATGLAMRLRHELTDPDASTALVIEGLSLELLGIAARRDEILEAGRIPRWLDGAREYIHAEMHRALRVPEVATAVGVHPVRLTRAFRRVFGVSPGQYLRRLRLDWAAEQLEQTELPIALIALRAGFADQSHFTRAFRRHAGGTPAAFRGMARRGRRTAHG
jgi:AraC family transcriptional regulator